MRPDPELIEKIRKCQEIPYNQNRKLLTNEQNLMLDELEPLRLGVILFEEIDAIERENSELKSKLAKMGIENGILKEVINYAIKHPGSPGGYSESREEIGDR